MLTNGLWAQKSLTYFKKEYVQKEFLTEDQCIDLLEKNNRKHLLDIYSFKNCLLTFDDFNILFLCDSNEVSMI